jgi:arylsulfatase A-like enzyme
MRWPGRVPEKRVSNEIVHCVDMFTTLAKLAGGDIPKDRMIDGAERKIEGLDDMQDFHDTIIRFKSET